MPMLIALLIAALAALGKPFRGLALGLFMLMGAVCLGIGVILWRFWIDCGSAVAHACGRDAGHAPDEEPRRSESTPDAFSPRFGEPIPLRTPFATHGKESRRRRPD